MRAQIIAIAGLTLREAVRRRTFLLLLIFVPVLMSSAAFFPSVEAADRVKLVAMWSVLATSFFGAVVAIFVAGMSLPTEFRKRRIFNLSSKPIRKSAIFLGRFVGFACALAVYVAATALMSIVFIRVIAWSSGDEVPPLRADPQLIPSSFVAGGPRVRFDDLNERYVIGAGYAQWDFERVNPEDFEDPIPAALTIEIYSGYEFSGHVMVQLSRSVGESTRELWRTPEEGMFVSTNVRKAFEIPRSVLEEKGPIRFRVWSVKPNHTIYARETSLALVQEPASYELNVVKGFSMIYLQTIILMAVVLAASVWVSAPVAMLVGISVLMVSTGYQIFDEGVRTTLAQVKTAEERSRSGATARPQEIPIEVLKISAAVTDVMLKIIPNFGKLNPTDNLVEEVDIPLSVLLLRWFKFIPYWLVPVLLGLLLMTFKEFS